MPDTACLNLRWSLALLDGLVSSGLRHVVISPGSRSTPLVLACERHPALTIKPVLDERSAAFYALGLALVGKRPVALIATSGSAPAHWLPAVIEAAQSAVPLILLSADRPPELRGWGANQTVDQQRFFGTFARSFHDPGPPREGPEALRQMRALGKRAASESLWPLPGPVHINLPFREPLVPNADCGAEPFVDSGEVALTSFISPGMEVIEALKRRLSEGNGLILCGPGNYPDDFGAAVTALGEQIGCPVFADPLAVGLRWGDHTASSVLCVRYDAFLRHRAIARQRPDWVLRFGGAPVSKPLLQWLEEVPAIVVDRFGRWRDPWHVAEDVVSAKENDLCRALAATLSEVPGNRNWLNGLQQAECDTADLAKAHIAGPFFEGQLVATLLEQLPAAAALLVGNSLPVRQLDGWSGTRSAPLRLFCNRGASGIDGNVSTLMGIAAAHDGPVVGLMGDLTLQHDLTGMAAMSRPVTLIVINNGGGAIFGYLPQRELPTFQTYWQTPQGLDLGAAARLFGFQHYAVDDLDGFNRALQSGLNGTTSTLIEVCIDGNASRQRHLDYWQAVAALPYTADPQ